MVMVDTKQTKTIGEHYVAAELARRGWAPALTRDGLERTDILAVMTEGGDRRLVEVQVKTARSGRLDSTSWPVGVKSMGPSLHQREFFVMVSVPTDEGQAPSFYILPRIHLAAAAWISHMSWLTDPEVPVGQRTAPIERARVALTSLSSYRDRWDLLLADQDDAQILLSSDYRTFALMDRVGLPQRHEWRTDLPVW